VCRRRGKSDPIDAYEAARAVLSERAAAAVKDESIEALRALNNARRSAVKARTVAVNQIQHMLITAPVPARGYRPMNDTRLVTALAACRPSTQESTARVVLTALKALAQRHQYLTSQAVALQEQIRDLARAANRALYTIPLVRMSCDARTRDDVRAQRAKGRTQPEILRLLKRAIAREVFMTLTRGLVAPELADLRPARQGKNITLRAAATAMNTYPNKILRTERGTFPDYDLAQRYRAWLNAA
jgi:hypothetical protein